MMTDDRTLPEAEDAFLQSLQEAPSPAFAQALGLRLRQMAETDADGAGARHSAPPRPVGRAGWGRQVGLATAAALLLAAAGSILVVVTPNGHAVLADAANSLGLHKYLPQKVLQSGEGFRPPFPVLEPAYVPEGLTLTLVAATSIAGKPTLLAGCEAAPATCAKWSTDGAVPPSLPREKELLRALGTGEPAVGWRFASPHGDRWIEITERVAHADVMLSSGQPLAVGDLPAMLYQADGAVTLTLLRAGLLITIRTNLGSEDAVRVAVSLR
jgi:hypothetical protein